MSTEIIDHDTIELIKKAGKIQAKLYDQVKNEFNDCVDKPNYKELLKCLKRKHKFLSRFSISKGTKITNCKAHIYELFMLDLFKDNFTEDEIKEIKKYCILKIRGLYKHAQALKTGFCNGQIINGFSEENTISVCITKNTLEANEQWLLRLFKELDNRFPQIKLNDKIMIISSKKNNLNGNAKHCKTINDAWSYLKKPNKFKIIFICSNKIRIQDIYEMATSFLDLRDELVKNLRIFHDEAHNPKEGIPPYRYIIENILILENILSYQPITASLGKIVDNNNPLWMKSNLEQYAINFTSFDKTKSNDTKYSSINDYEKIKFEDLKSNKDWQNYDRKDVSRKNFIKVDDKYKRKELHELSQENFEDIDYRRTLEFCQFMANHKEITALNNGLNVLNLNSILDFQYYIKDKFNLHIISTPCRKIISYELCLEACKKDYNPIVLGIYGNQGDKYHLFLNGQNEKVMDYIMGEGEFNCKLYNLIKYLKDKGYNTDRPFIIIGNYTPTGESLSYVNYEYGTVRGVIRLISTNAEEDYQSGCRGNYMNTKFLEHDSNWKPPKKFLIGEENFINNALSYETENDARIDYLNNLDKDPNVNNIVLPSINVESNNQTGTTAIPIRIVVDTDHKNYEKIIELASKPRRTCSEKELVLELLKESINDPESDFEANDKTGKFNWGDKDEPRVGMELKDFRCYTKDCKNKKGYWKFKNYNNNFITGATFINNTSNHVARECEILICKDKYIIKNDNGDVIEKNSKTIWWIGYKY
jgi:hypothetical protein